MLALGLFITSCAAHRISGYLQRYEAQHINIQSIAENSIQARGESSQYTQEQQVVITQHPPCLNIRFLGNLGRHSSNSIASVVFRSTNLLTEIAAQAIRLINTPERERRPASPPILLITNEPITTDLPRTSSSSERITNLDPTPNIPTTIVVSEKIYQVYKQLKDIESTIQDNLLHTLHKMPESSKTRHTNNTATIDQLHNLAAKLLKAGIAKKNKPILQTFYKAVNWVTDWNWKTAKEIEIEFGRKLFINSTTDANREEKINELFTENQEQIRKILTPAN